MSEPDEVPAPAETPEPHGTPKLPKASSTAVVIRESDRMRTGIDAAVLDVATGTLTLLSYGQFAAEEPIKIRLKNVVQRFEKETRGLVKKVTAGNAGVTTLDIELLSRLSALEVSLVKMGIAAPQEGSTSKWV
jgi:hypothetical protein